MPLSRRLVNKSKRVAEHTPAQSYGRCVEPHDRIQDVRPTREDEASVCELHWFSRTLDTVGKLVDTE
jgi:hypothetical protein